MANRQEAQILRATAITKSFGTTSALRGVDLVLGRGEIVALMGPSGSGKSTLLHVLAGLLKPDEGEVWLGNERLDALPDASRSEIRLKRMGLVFQFGALIPELSLVENVELPLLAAHIPKRECREKAESALRLVGIEALKSRMVIEVSGGEAQRAAIARSLVNQPEIVFADEPTGALDSRSGDIVMEALVDASSACGAGVVLVTHDPRVASWADRVVSLVDGKILHAAEVHS